MKKQNLMKIALLVLPLLVVLVASGPSGVTVFDGENTAYYSWHQLVVKSSLGWCAPVAMLLNYCVFALAVVYGLLGKTWSVKGIFGISFAAACIAALPIVVQSDIKVVPNVMGVIFLGAESMAAYLVMKKAAAEKEAKPRGKRLENRR